jgi:hypothetical protein
MDQVGLEARRDARRANSDPHERRWVAGRPWDRQEKLVRNGRDMRPVILRDQETDILGAEGLDLVGGDLLQIGRGSTYQSLREMKNSRHRCSSTLRLAHRHGSQR